MFTEIPRRRRVAALLTLAAALTVAAPVVEARPGGGGSVGSRGSRTYTAPSATPTAPGGGSTMQRSQNAPSPGMGSPGRQAPAAPVEVGGALRATRDGAGEPAEPAGVRKADISVGSSTELLELQQGKAADAPLCLTCGTKMRPAGSCYVCDTCGSTSGCS